MICNPCKMGNHADCPNMGENWRTDMTQAHGTGLSPEADKVQRSGLCPCQHKTSAKSDDQR